LLLELSSFIQKILKIKIMHDLRRECNKINEMIDGLSGILKRLIEDHKKLIVKLEDIMTHIQDIDTREKIQNSLEILNNEVHYVTSTMAVFKLEEDLPSPGTSSQQEK
jgi:hypothetical protein